MASFLTLTREIRDQIYVELFDVKHDKHSSWIGYFLVNKQFGLEAQKALLSKHPLVLVHLVRYDSFNTQARKEISGCSAFRVKNNQPAFTRFPHYTMRIRIENSRPGFPKLAMPSTPANGASTMSNCEHEDRREADGDYILLIGYSQLAGFSEYMAIHDFSHAMFQQYPYEFEKFAITMSITEKSASTVPSVNEHCLLEPFSALWRGLSNINVVGVHNQQLLHSFKGEVTSKRWMSQQEFFDKVDAMIVDGDRLVESKNEEYCKQALDLGQRVVFLAKATLGSKDGRAWFKTSSDVARGKSLFDEGRRVAAIAAIELHLDEDDIREFLKGLGVDYDDSGENP